MKTSYSDDHKGEKLTVTKPCWLFIYAIPASLSLSLYIYIYIRPFKLLHVSWSFLLNNLQSVQVLGVVDTRIVVVNVQDSGIVLNEFEHKTLNYVRCQNKNSWEWFSIIFHSEPLKQYKMLRYGNDYYWANVSSAIKKKKKKKKEGKKINAKHWLISRQVRGNSK